MVTLEARSHRLALLKNFGRATDAFQIIVLATFGQYLAEGGAQQLKAPHWDAARAFFGGYQNVGISLIAIACIGLLGLFSLAWTKRDVLYTWLMWIYSISAFLWFAIIGITHAIARSGSTGLWSLGLAGCFFLFTRIAITIATPLQPEAVR
ncbi:membrane protein [Mycobacterium phage Phabba]|uniref:Membrane protein n=1 Tax=Mycobacterium phage Phabba TaxID=2027899 RepID=A0A249XSP7_9CAUD|nr:membrane protein [Mycobacterium phage Phabba]ASZ74763.1 membrane protein [Mycobacterium phage Phabba]